LNHINIILFSENLSSGFLTLKFFFQKVETAILLRFKIRFSENRKHYFEYEYYHL